MLMLSRNEFENSINNIRDEEVKEKLMRIYDGVKGISKENVDLYILLQEVLKSLFDPYGITKGITIPLSFLETTLGALVIDVINGRRERYFLVNDLIEMSKSPKRPKGYTRQHIRQEIEAGRLKAAKVNGRWIIPEEEAIRFLKERTDMD